MMRLPPVRCHTFDVPERMSMNDIAPNDEQQRYDVIYGAQHSLWAMTRSGRKIS